MQYLINEKDKEHEWDLIFVEKILDIPTNLIFI